MSLNTPSILQQLSTCLKFLNAENFSIIDPAEWFY